MRLVGRAYEKEILKDLLDSEEDELLENWHLALNHQRLLKIEPLY